MFDTPALNELNAGFCTSVTVFTSSVQTEQHPILLDGVWGGAPLNVTMASTVFDEDVPADPLILDSLFDGCCIKPQSHERSSLKFS